MSTYSIHVALFNTVYIKIDFHTLASSLGLSKNPSGIPSEESSL